MRPQQDGQGAEDEARVQCGLGSMPIWCTLNEGDKDSDVGVMDGQCGTSMRGREASLSHPRRTCWEDLGPRIPEYGVEDFAGS